MRLSFSKSKNSTSLYVIKDVTEKNKRTTKIVEKLGTVQELEEKLNGQDPIQWAKKHIEELNQKEIEDNRDVLVKYNQSKRIELDVQRSFNGGYLFLQQLYHQLVLHKISKDISSKYKFTFNFDSILSRLVYGRILFPSSKLNTYQESKQLLEQGDFELQHIYRGLEIIAKEADFIQSELYENSLAISKRNDHILYYDCTNYFFEIEEEDGLEQKLIVTYSLKYRDYQRKIRSRQLDRAIKLIETRPNDIKKKNQNDFKRLISSTNVIEDGEIADKTVYALNSDAIAKEEMYDGFYAVCTNLDEDAEVIAKSNHRRWEIEECFRIMKSEFKARPVYLSRDDRIEAHFTTCFLALVLYRYLEKYLDEKFTTQEIVTGLREMNFHPIPTEGYIPTYTRTNFTDTLHDFFGFRTDSQIVSTKQMKRIFKYTKKGKTLRKF